MNARLAARLVALYPRRWRERYGDELLALLEAGDSGLAHIVVDVLRSALLELLVPTQGGNMQPTPYTFASVSKRPSAFLPLAMSFTALTMVLLYVALYGHARQPDEGAVAHLWQLLMAGQLPIMLFFAIRWLPRARRQTSFVLAEQLGAALASVATVFLLGLG